MAAQVNINNIEASGQNIKVTGFIVLSGNYPTGGDPLNFTGSGSNPVGVDPSFIGNVPAIESSVLLNLDVWSMGGSAINGANSLQYNPVATKSGSPAVVNPATGAKLKCSALSATPSTEHSAAAYEAQFTGDTIAFMAVFTKNI